MNIRYTYGFFREAGKLYHVQPAEHVVVNYQSPDNLLCEASGG